MQQHDDDQCNEALRNAFGRRGALTHLIIIEVVAIAKISVKFQNVQDSHRPRSVLDDFLTYLCCASPCIRSHPYFILLKHVTACSLFVSCRVAVIYQLYF